MSMDVIDAYEGFAEGPGQGLGSGYANQEGSDQTRTMGDGYRIDIVQFNVCALQRLPYHRQNALDMRAAGDLGNYAAIFCVEGDLAGDDVAEDALAVFDDRGRGLVAG
jgi:hypothetical protein